MSCIYKRKSICVNFDLVQTTQVAQRRLVPMGPVTTILNTATDCWTVEMVLMNPTAVSRYRSDYNRTGILPPLDLRIWS